MSNSDIKKTIIPMPIMKEYHMLSANKTADKSVIMIIITYISEEEEKELDAGKEIHIIRGDMEFNINPNKVYCYGNVDFTTGSDDYNLIEESPIFDFLNFLTDVGIHIPSDYIFETHECHSPIDRVRWTETWNPAQIAQYSYACIGKPDRIVLFKYVKAK